MAAHRYWRLLGLRCLSGQAYSGVSGVRLYEGEGGPDVAPEAAASYTQSPQYTQGSIFGSGAGSGSLVQFEGDVHKGIIFDFGAGNEKELTALALYPNRDSAARTWSDIEIARSDDGADWETGWWAIRKGSGWDSGTFTTITRPAAEPHQHWRVRPELSQDGDRINACAELAIYGSVGGINLSLAGVASAPDQFAFYSPAWANDDNPGTFWIGDRRVERGCWIAVALPSPVDAAQVGFTAPHDGSFNRCPASGWVESSPDGESFLPRLYFSGVTWTANQVVTFNLGEGGGYPEDAAARLTQAVALALATGSTPAKLAQGAALSLGTGTFPARLTEAHVRAMWARSTPTRASQAAVLLLARPRPVRNVTRQLVLANVF